jgi:hypothetical protein
LLSSRHVALGLAVLASSLALIVVALKSTSPGLCRAAALTAAAVLLMSLATDLFVTSIVNTFRSGRAFGEVAAEHAPEDDPIVLYMKRFDGVCSLYTELVHMSVLQGHEQLMEALSNPQYVVIAARKTLARTDSAAAVKSHIVLTDGIGPRTMVLMRGRAPDAP